MPRILKQPNESKTTCTSEQRDILQELNLGFEDNLLAQNNIGKLLT